MIIIPARIGSSRFPNKVLADISGVPMVVRTAMAVSDIDDVVIATDSQEVANIVKNHDFKAILTSTKHKSGTDRIYEAVEKLDLNEDEIIINVQGDEPFIETEIVQSIYDLSKKNRDNDDIMMNSCYKNISNLEADDPNIVKVITDIDDLAIYFSRAKVPYPRDHHFDGYKGHLGIYGFTVKSLRKFCLLSPAAPEGIEKLEQLRAIYHGYKIAMIKVNTENFGIDTLEDLEQALKHHRL